MVKMYRRVMAGLSWETPTERDMFRDELAEKLPDISTFDENVYHGEDMEGNSRSAVDIRPENDEDADALYNRIKDMMDKIPALKGRVTIHDCKHDEGPPFEPCKIQEEYEV